jgi:SHS2 domain-containing protein
MLASFPHELHKNGISLDRKLDYTHFMRSEAGFSEREHTADWELEVWAPDFPGLLAQAAQGMYSISGVRLKEEPPQKREIHLTALDRESLLVRFLTELLILGEQEHLGFDVYQLALEGEQLSAVLEGAPIASQDKEIKAVTYHNLSIRETGQGLMVNIVFDV